MRVATIAAPQRQCPPNVWRTTQLAGGALQLNLGGGANHTIDHEVAVWSPNATPVQGIRILVRWESRRPGQIDLSRGLIMFDGETPLRHSNGVVPKKGLMLELRAHSGPSWEGHSALRDKISARYGPRLSADWADVQAMARGSDGLFLVTRHKDRVVDTVALPRSVFEFPAAAIEAALTAARAEVRGPLVPCPDEATDIVVT